MIKKLIYFTMAILCITTLSHAQTLISGGLGVDYSTQEDVVTNLRVTLSGDQYHFDFDVNQDGIQAKRGYLYYSPNNHVQLRIGNIRQFSGIAASQGYTSQWFVSQVDGFNRSHKPGLAAVGSYEMIGYQLAVFESEDYLGRVTANVLPNLQVGMHYYSEEDRYGLEASAQFTNVSMQAEFLPSTEHYYMQALYEPEGLPVVGYRYANVSTVSHAILLSHRIGGVEVGAEYGWSEEDDVMMVSLLKRF